MLLFNFMKYGLLVFMYLVTCDSLFSAIHFLIMYVNKNMTKVDVIAKTSTLYVLSWLDRYVWYFACGLIYQTFCSILWINNIQWIIWGFVVMNFPFVQNYLVRNSLKDLFELIIKNKKNFIKESLSKQLSTIINSIGTNYMNRQNKIVNHEDVSYIFDSYDQTMDNLHKIIKNTVVVLLITYLKSCSPYYYSIAKRVYNYKSIDSINTMTKDKVKIMLNDICEKKQWEKLLEPNFIQVILFVYCDEEFKSKNNIISQIVTRVNYSILKFFAVWTISSLTGFQITGPIIFYALYYYKWQDAPVYNIKTLMKIGGITLGALSCLFLNNYCLICFISEFAYYIIFNSATKMLCDTLIKKSTQIVSKYQNLENQDLMDFGIQIVCGLSICLITGDNINIHYSSGFAILMSILVLYIAQDDMRRVIPIVSLLLIGEFSTYHPVHILLNVHHYYMLTNYAHSDHFYNTLYEIQYKSKYKFYEYLEKFNKEMRLKLESQDSGNKKSVTDNNSGLGESYMDHTIVLS